MDVSSRLSRIAFFDVIPDVSSLSDTERVALDHCVAAAQTMTDIYWRQVSPENPAWLEALQRRSDAEGRDLLRYIQLNGGPWDQFSGDEPFLPNVGARPRGAAFYPADLTEQEWQNSLKSHPENSKSLLSTYTVIRREQNRLVAVPYSVEYARFLTEADKHLRAAAHALPSGTLKRFLELRASAFSSNSYRESDLAWIDTDGHPFEVTIGPYEVYLDRLLGLKSTFEAFIGLPDSDSTSALQAFSPLVPEFDRILAGRFGYEPKSSAIPLEVVSDVYRGGEAAFGRQFVAYNLPNDRAIHEMKGSKKVFSRTMMQAKFERLTSQMAGRLLPSSALAHFTFGNRLLFVLCHELAHGLGWGLLKRGDGETSESMLGDLHSLIEEAKANTLGVALLKHFVDAGLLSDEQLEGAITTELVQYIQEWRTGFHEAHSAGSLIEYNWLRAHDALHTDAANNLQLDIDRAVTALTSLSYELLRLQSQASYDQAKAFVQQWSAIKPEMSSLVARVKDLPFEVLPVYHPPVAEELHLQ